MSKRNRHAAHEEHIDESWLIPYADILTLLLALFIVLFASSSVNEEKYQKVFEALAGEFNPGSLHPASDPDGDGFPFDPDILLTITPSPPEETEEPDTEDPDGDTGGPMGNIYSSLKDYISGNNLENTVKVEYNGEKILLTLQNDIWFASGSASLTVEMREKGGILAQILKETLDPEDPFEIIIAGHTDSRPIATARFPSNLHLSAYRAVEFQLFLIDESGLDPKYFSSRGYGELRPIAPNDTAEGQQLNRRVELLISQDKKQAVEDDGSMSPG